MPDVRRLCAGELRQPGHDVYGECGLQHDLAMRDAVHDDAQPVHSDEPRRAGDICIVRRRVREHELRAERLRILSTDADRVGY